MLLLLLRLLLLLHCYSTTTIQIYKMYDGGCGEGRATAVACALRLLLPLSVEKHREDCGGGNVGGVEKHRGGRLGRDARPTAKASTHSRRSMV